jgi:hypothetical protein
VADPLGIRRVQKNHLRTSAASKRPLTLPGGSKETLKNAEQKSAESATERVRQSESFVLD